MVAPSAGIFLPGFAARASIYRACLPHGWDVVQPPTPRATGGSLGDLRRWAVREVRDRSGRTLVAGHSMGAALAVLAAANAAERVDRLVLIAPAGLPLSKSIARSGADLIRQVATHRYALADVLTSARDVLSAPRSATRLGRALRRLDLSTQLTEVRRQGTSSLVVGCTTDTLVTPTHSRTVAALLGADYLELALPGGHMWMLDHPQVLAELLADASTTTIGGGIGASAGHRRGVAA